MSKRCFIALALLLVMLIGSPILLSAVHRSVLEPEDKVEFNIVQSVGDPAKAAGLKAQVTETSTNYLRHFYGLSFSGKEPEISVGHEYGQAGQTRILLSDIIQISVDIINNDAMYALIDEFEKASADLKPGESRSVSIRFRDYFEYCPVKVHWTAEDRSVWYDSDDTYYEEQGRKYHQKQFEEAFRIPVPDDLRATLVIKKWSDENYQSDFSEVDGDLLQFDFSGYLFDGNYYLFCRMGGIEGYSNIVFRIPYGKLKEPLKDKGVPVIEYGPLVDQMEPWYVPEAPYDLAGYQTLFLSSNEDVLYVLNTDGSTTHVAALKKGEKTPFELDVPDIGGTNCPMFLNGSDLVFYVKDSAYHYVYPLADSSGFEKKTFPIAKGELQPRPGGYHDNTLLAFDGDRLAVCNTMAAVSEEASRVHFDGFFVSVYSQAGLEYSVKYRTSIADAADFSTGTRYYNRYNLAINSLSW